MSPLVPRHQLAVRSPVTARGLVAGLGAALGLGRHAHAAEEAVRERYGAARALLTDSGTSALVLALRIAAGRGGTVAFPGYSCVDLAAAARHAGVRVRLYDLDRRTLGPDMDSLERALERGVDAVVVVHLYGHPCDAPAVASLARRFGVPVIEDAAQAAGGALCGIPLGAFGDLSVLSFGRGKGTTGGQGGALLARDPLWRGLLDRAAEQVRPASAGWGNLVKSAAQLALGRPSLYHLPASIPALALGEMVYHPAHEPEAIPRSAAAILTDALERDPIEVEARRRNARALLEAVRGRDDLLPVREIDGSECGYLRLPVLDLGGRASAPRLGIMRGYPRTLHEQEELRPCLVPGEPPTPGARWLRERLFTLPTHGLLADADAGRVRGWIGSGARSMAAPAARDDRARAIA